MTKNMGARNDKIRRKHENNEKIRKKVPNIPCAYTIRYYMEI
jgi:hypothetical protein